MFYFSVNILPKCITKIYFTNILPKILFTDACDFKDIPEFLDTGRKSWTLYSGLWTLGFRHWTLEARLWTLDIGFSILDVKTLRSTVNPFQANVLFLFNHLKISRTRGFQRFSDDMESELQLEMN